MSEKTMSHSAIRKSRRGECGLAAHYASERHQGGYILIAAILIMLVLSGIALTLAKLSISQNSVVEQALLRARTDLVLDAGSQWVTQVTLELNACLPPNSQIYFDESGMNEANESAYTVDTSCAANLTYQEGSNTFNRFPIQVQADYKELELGGGLRNMVVRRSVLEF